jgi:hypothetical protein
MKPKEQPSRLLYETMEYHVRRPDMKAAITAREPVETHFYECERCHLVVEREPQAGLRG